MTTTPGIGSLHRLARMYGVQSAYYDVEHRRQAAPLESLLAVLRSMGAPVQSLADVPSALRQGQQALWQRPLEPVLVAWEGRLPMIDLRLPIRQAEEHPRLDLVLENGDRLALESHTNSVIMDAAEVEGTEYVVKRVRVDGHLPCGYHRLLLEVGGNMVESLVISAPTRLFCPLTQDRSRSWGVFVPLYALHSGASWQAGDLSDLEALACWLVQMGGDTVATLPLLPTFPGRASPYEPISRLVWSELFIHLDHVPELADCPEARTVMASPPFRSEIAGLRSLSHVDYDRLMSLRRRILEELCACCFSTPSRRLAALQEFAAANPTAADYARFRSTWEKEGATWPSWPQRQRDGLLADGDYDEKDRRYHLYVQWLIDQQVQHLCDSFVAKGLKLYLDLPLGVHREGYDTWRHRDIFASEVSGGAPPDAVFTGGQDWSFRPLHPQKLREKHYDYFAQGLRHHLRRGGLLRIDHVMGFHRLFWIPQGLDPRHGVYVRYPAEEMYAVLSLESHRQECLVVGENLGTVPTYVNKTLRKHSVHQMYVIQYELAVDTHDGLPTPPARSVASLNTHDMPTFAGFWHGLDIEERRSMGLLDPAGATRELRERKKQKEVLARLTTSKADLTGSDSSLMEVLGAAFEFLGASPARVVLVNLEDLWFETQPQNLPGTGNERGNWRHRLRYPIEEFAAMHDVVSLLRRIQRSRNSRSIEHE